LTAPGTGRLNLKCEEPLSKIAFKFNLRRYTLAEQVRGELKGSRDIAKLCLGVQALCHVAALGPAGTDQSGGATARVSAMQGVLALMVNRYPRVRRTAAEQLYVLLLVGRTASCCGGPTSSNSLSTLVS